MKSENFSRLSDPCKSSDDKCLKSATICIQSYIEIILHCLHRWTKKVNFNKFGEHFVLSDNADLIN